MTAQFSPGSPPRFPPFQLSPVVTDILLIEDSPLEVELTLRPIRELEPGRVVEVARDGEEALDFLFARGAFRHRAGAAPPRLILLALKLPKLDGFDVLRAIRTNSRTSTVPVVVLTSADDPRELAQCYQLGANSCVQKPVRSEPLRSVLQAVARYWLNLNQPPPGPASPLT
ncbi:MAG TPA: response regulator [Gemmatimonadales bacterium]|nr:response regulator [Gemmatimonadales bacterium]